MDDHINTSYYKSNSRYPHKVTIYSLDKEMDWENGMTSLEYL